MGAHRHGQRVLPHPWKSWKVLSRNKTPFPKSVCTASTRSAQAFVTMCKMNSLLIERLLIYDGQGWSSPDFASLNMCYHVKFGSFASKGVRRDTREPPNWGSLRICLLAIEAWLTPEIHASPHVLIFRNLVILGQTVPALLSRSAWKKLTPRVPPCKVIQGHRNRPRSIRHLWLPTNVP